MSEVIVGDIAKEPAVPSEQLTKAPGQVPQEPVLAITTLTEERAHSTDDKGRVVVCCAK